MSAEERFIKESNKFLEFDGKISFRPPELRDFFARNIDVDAILQNLNDNQIEIIMNKTQPHSIKQKIKFQAELHAKLRYLFADAMITERENR